MSDDGELTTVTHSLVGSGNTHTAEFDTEWGAWVFVAKLKELGNIEYTLSDESEDTSECSSNETTSAGQEPVGE